MRHRMNVLRRHRLLHGLALLAILAQLLLPMRHALAMAQAGHDPLQMAFCGLASPGALQQLRDTAPPELVQALVRARTDSAAARLAVHAACDDCAGMSAPGTAALGGHVPALQLLAASPALPRAEHRVAVAHRPHLTPPSRGPPSIVLIS